MEKVKIENTQVFGFESALRGMRNPMNSWDKSDSFELSKGSEIAHKEGYGGNFIDNTGKLLTRAECSKMYEANEEEFLLGNADKILAQKLTKAGSEHCKFLRQIHVWADFTFPRYIWQEADTYKFGSKNSQSTMHKLTSKEITIDDFLVNDEISNILKRYKPTYDGEFICDVNEDVIKSYEFTVSNKQFVIFSNGKIIRKEFKVTDSMGRNRVFPEIELAKHKTKDGYFATRIAGKTELVHRLLATAFLEKTFGCNIVNHKNGKKNDCSLTNLEWTTSAENNTHAINTGLKLPTTEYARYKAYITNRKLSVVDVKQIINRVNDGETQSKVAKDYDILQTRVSELMLAGINPNAELYEEVYIWENIINHLNSLRELYLDTKDYNYFIRIKQLLPESYLQLRTWDTNYAELLNIYNQRKNHKLKYEWQDVFCTWVENLPYFVELTGIERKFS